MAYIHTISMDKAEGLVKSNHESNPKATGIHYETGRVLGLWPELQSLESRRYELVMLRETALPRSVKEMIGATVSASNHCDYCVQHHVAMMVEAGVDAAEVWLIVEDYTQAGLDDKTQAILAFALTGRPDLTQQTNVDRLCSLGCSDREILEAVIVAGFFRDYNLRVSILGLELEDWFKPILRNVKS